MPEPTNPGQPSDSATERGSPVNINTSGNVTVTRKNVSTGDVKDDQSEALSELSKSVSEQTKTMASLLAETKKEIEEIKKLHGGTEKSGKGFEELVKTMQSIAAQSGAGGGGEGGGGGDGGGDRGYSQFKAATKQWELMEEAGDIVSRTGIPAFEKFFDIFKTGAMTKFEQNMNRVNQAVFDFGERLADINGAARKTMGTVEEMFKAGQGGMIDITALYEDLGAGLMKNRDALNATFPVVQEFAEKQRMLIGTLGSNLEDVARSFKENREAAKAAFGDEFLERIPFAELNEIQTTMLEQQRRSGVKATDNEILTSQRAHTQMQLLKDISFATGKTVAEVIKLQEEEGMTLEELRANGLVSEQTKQNLQAQFLMFKSMGMEGLPQMMQDIAEAGGITRFKGQEGVAAMMAQGNNDALVKELYDISRSGQGGTNEGMQRMLEIASQMQGLEDQTAEVASDMRTEFSKQIAIASINATRVKTQQDALREKGLPAGLEALTKAQKDTEGGPGGTAQGWFNTLRETIENNLGGGGELAIALSYNTLALIANTGALFMKGGGGGVIKGALKGGGNLLKKIPGAAKLMGLMGLGGGAAAMNPATAAAAKNADKFTKGFNPTTTAGVDQATKATGKQTAKMAGKAGIKSILKKIPLVGLIAGLGFGIGRAMDGDWTGAGAEIASGAASLVPGIGTAASVGIDAALFASDLKKAQEDGVAGGPNPDSKGVAPSAGDKATVAPAGVRGGSTPAAPNANSVYVQLVAQTSHLSMLVGLMQQGNATRDTMLDTIGQGVMETPGKPTMAGNRRGRTRAIAAFTPLLYDGGPSA